MIEPLALIALGVLAWLAGHVNRPDSLPAETGPIFKAPRDGSRRPARIKERKQ